MTPEEKAMKAGAAYFPASRPSTERNCAMQRSLHCSGGSISPPDGVACAVHVLTS